MSVIKGINIPSIDPNGLNNQTYMRKVLNCITELQDNLRYAIENIDEDNITKKFIDDLTVKNLLITNEENSIVANPKEGFKMLKGSKPQLTFDMETGEAAFGGTITGGSIESANYIPYVAGTKINLSDGTIETKQFKINGNGEITIGNGINILNIRSGDFYIGNYDEYISLNRSSIYMTKSTNGVVTKIPFILDTSNVDDVIFMLLGSGRFTTLYENNVSLTNKYAAKSHTHGSVSGSFTSSDGKTITVTKGIVTSIS